MSKKLYYAKIKTKDLEKALGGQKLLTIDEAVEIMAQDAEYWLKYFREEEDTK